MPKVSSQTRDFSLDAYRDLLSSIKQNDFEFYCFQDRPFLRQDINRHVILRHDVDRMPARALKIAELEADEGIRSTFFFRTKSVSFNKRIIHRILTMGHEIGYHYECLSDTRGDIDKAWQLFKQEIKKFEDICEIKSIAMHGRPLLPFDNRDLWDHFDYHDIGINIEVYKDVPWNKYVYFTDVSSRWDSENNLRDHIPDKNSQIQGIRTTPELIDFVETLDRNLIVSTHPERWPSSKTGWVQARLMDLSADYAKKFLKRIQYLAHK
ncbi:MAG: hypothetical protein U5P41_04010 [Gammaproteobacteria bacterium]|nr:hypothetical protein [Gammaproteobacteria bacterium]